MAQFPHDLSALLTGLRVEGIPIGPDEIARLAHVFEQGPALDRGGLRELLACTLIKNPAQRSCFDTLFDVWCPEDKEPGRPAAGEDEPEGIAVTPLDSSDQARSPLSEKSEKSKKGGTEDAAPKAEPEPEPKSGQAIPETPHTGSRLRRWVLVGTFMLLGLVIIGALLFWYWPESPQPVELKPLEAPPSVELEEPTGESGESRENRENSESSGPSLSRDSIDSIFEAQTGIRCETSPLSRLYPFNCIVVLLIIVLAVVFVGYFLYDRWRSRSILEHRPRWVPLTKSQRAEGRLIDTAARRRLVWNVGRFQSEELTRRVDLAATAQATARAAGVIEIRREQAVYPREIWLWEDELCADPALSALAAELEQELGRAGLVVRWGGFAELPHRIYWSGDDSIQPLMVDGHQRNAMVAVLTDGEGLALAMDSDLEGRRTRGLLAGLRHWPRLVFVDFSASSGGCRKSPSPAEGVAKAPLPPGEGLGRGDQKAERGSKGEDRCLLRHPPSVAGGRVAGLVAPFGLACIRPEELHRWLGGETIFAASAAGEIGPDLVGEERLWAAACALGGRSLGSEEALTLHGHLGLRCPTWSYRRLVADADNARLSWSAAARHSHINWLIGSERLAPDGEIPDSSRLRLALDWWRHYLERDAEFRRRHEGALTPWRYSPAQRERILELALLDLFTDPDRVSQTLDDLARQGLAETIRERLAEFAARDQRPLDESDPRDAIYLPWAIGDLPPSVQLRLRQLGFKTGGLSRRPVRETWSARVPVLILSTLVLVLEVLYLGLNPYLAWGLGVVLASALGVGLSILVLVLASQPWA